MPPDIPAGHPAGEDLCGWPVRMKGHGAWRCNLPMFHETEHCLVLGDRVRARSAGYLLADGTLPCLPGRRRQP